MHARESGERERAVFAFEVPVISGQIKKCWY